MALPLGLPPHQMESTWKAQIDPVLNCPIIDGIPLLNIVLVANTPKTLNHSLSRPQRGYFITYQNANANIWVTQPFNSQTITIEASANVTISLWNY